jgi:hypothetical protein
MSAGKKPMRFIIQFLLFSPLVRGPDEIMSVGRSGTIIT